MLTLFCSSVAQVGPKVVEPSLGLLEKTVIGSLLILSWAIALLAIIQLIRVQNARVADQKAMNETAIQLTDKMITAFTEMKSAIQELKAAEVDGQEVMRTVQASMGGMCNRLDFLTTRIDMLMYNSGVRRPTPKSFKSPPNSGD